MPSKIIPLTAEHLNAAVELFIANYQQEQEQSPLLPPQVIDEPERIRNALQACLSNPGVAIVKQQRLLGYMVTGFQFAWKGQRAALVHEYGHSAVEPQKRELYQRMYMHLAQQWADQRIHLHTIAHFAHDSVLKETLYQLGFGAILAERLREVARDLAPVRTRDDLTIVAQSDVDAALVALELDHNRYYPKSPIFILKNSEASEVRADLEAHIQQGDMIFTYREGQVPQAYIIVGESAHEGEGFLLRGTNTAQVKSAYARPEARGKGIGKAMLQHVIQWARQQGYERLFVEHETANLFGGDFWRKHFTPYLYFSMRYIDNTI